MAKGSYWRARAQQIIVPILDGLPDGVARKDALKAMRDAYPKYASEKIGWAHKAWCSVRREEMKRRGLDDPNARRPTKTVVITPDDVNQSRLF